MSKTYDTIDAPLKEFITRQQMFFVATAPLAGDGLVNLSPKGLDSLRLGEQNRTRWRSQLSANEQRDQPQRPAGTPSAN